MHECKKIQVDFKNQQAHASLIESYMGTYELSGYKNGKPYWLSLSALIGFNNNWMIADLHRGRWDDLITSSVKSERPTQNKNNWFKMLAHLISINEDISVKCTGNICFEVIPP